MLLSLKVLVKLTASLVGLDAGQFCISFSTEFWFASYKFLLILKGLCSW